MKAKDLAGVLLKHPEAEVFIQNYEDLGPTFRWKPGIEDIRIKGSELVIDCADEGSN